MFWGFLLSVFFSLFFLISGFGCTIENCTRENWLEKSTDLLGKQVSRSAYKTSKLKNRIGNFILRRMSLTLKKKKKRLRGTCMKNRKKMSLNNFCSNRFWWMTSFSLDFLTGQSFLHHTITGFCVYCCILFYWY